MVYEEIKSATFSDRPNRFIANVILDSKKVVCHVKNTGRCKELLTEGAAVYISKSKNPLRKTKYDLISVIKNGMLINMDSQAPNAVFREWIKDKFDYIKPEYTYSESRFDFYMEKGEQRFFAEVKGVTLEEDGVVRFPDAPTERGLKHIRELIKAAKNGYEAWIVFVVQMENCKYFEPNRVTHPEFADALSEAEKSGVKIKCLRCDVSPTSLKIADNPEVEVRLR